MAFVSEDGGNDAEDNRRQIKSDIAYRSQQFSQLAGSTHATSLVYLVVATDQWYLHEVTTTVLEESGAKYVICASIEDILVSDVVRKDIYERETSGRQSPLYVINNVGSVQGNTTQNLAAMDFLHTATDSLGAAQDATFVLLWWDTHSVFASSSVAWKDHLRLVWSNENPAFNVDALIGRITRVIIQPSPTFSSYPALTESPDFICPSLPFSHMSFRDLLENSQWGPLLVVVAMILFVLFINVSRGGWGREVALDDKKTGVKCSHERKKRTKKSAPKIKAEVSEFTNNNQTTSAAITLKSRLTKEKEDIGESCNEATVKVSTTPLLSTLKRGRRSHTGK